MAYRNVFRDFLAKYVVSAEDVPRLRRHHFGHGSQRNVGYHWLEYHYRLPIYQVIWHNILRFHFTREVLVGRDWRGNCFFIKEDPKKPGGVVRYAKFIERHELPQDYDTDLLWKKWLEYRTAAPPTPGQCARLYKYQDEKYDISKVALARLEQSYAEDPPHEQVRRYQEYLDQKWDVRRSNALKNNIYGQRWQTARENQPDIMDKAQFSLFQSQYEVWLHRQVDLLRPPRRQHVWRVEDDARALKFIDELENLDYKLNPFEKTRKERYMNSPSYVAGTEVPESQIKSVPLIERHPLPRVPYGEHLTRITDRIPIYGMSSSSQYKKWFAEQRKHLIAARSELEQMKREGFRPREVGGDEDPYLAAVPEQTQKEEAHKRFLLLDTARKERDAIESRKAEALNRLLGRQNSDLAAALDQQAVVPFEETAVYTRVEGKIVPGAAKKYRLKQLEKVRQNIAPNDDTEQLSEDSSKVRSVFGSKGNTLFASGIPVKEGDEQVRPDSAGPNLSQPLSTTDMTSIPSTLKMRKPTDEEEKCTYPKASYPTLLFHNNNAVFNMQGAGRVPPPTVMVSMPRRHQQRMQHDAQEMWGAGHGWEQHHPITLGNTCSRTDKITTVLRLYKTKMCKNWKLYGECPYEKKCMFAHGDNELRMVIQSEEECMQQFESAGVRVYITPQQEGFAADM